MRCEAQNEVLCPSIMWHPAYIRNTFSTFWSPLDCRSECNTPTLQHPEWNLKACGKNYSKSQAWGNSNNITKVSLAVFSEKWQAHVHRMGGISLDTLVVILTSWLHYECTITMKYWITDFVFESAILNCATAGRVTCLCCIQHFAGAAAMLPWGERKYFLSQIGLQQPQRIYLVLHYLWRWLRTELEAAVHCSGTGVGTCILPCLSPTSHFPFLPLGQPSTHLPSALEHLLPTPDLRKADTTPCASLTSYLGAQTYLTACLWHLGRCRSLVSDHLSTQDCALRSTAWTQGDWKGAQRRLLGVEDRKTGHSAMNCRNNPRW